MEADHIRRDETVLIYMFGVLMRDLIADDLAALDRGGHFLRLVLSEGRNLLYHFLALRRAAGKELVCPISTLIDAG